MTPSVPDEMTIEQDEQPEPDEEAFETLDVQSRILDDVTEIERSSQTIENPIRPVR